MSLQPSLRRFVGASRMHSIYCIDGRSISGFYLFMSEACCNKHVRVCHQSRPKRIAFWIVEYLTEEPTISLFMQASLEEGPTLFWVPVKVLDKRFSERAI